MNKKNYLYIGAALVVLILGGVGYYLLRAVNPDYATVKVERKDVVETVRSHGIISAAQNVDLSFDRSGRVSLVYVKVGDKVKAGDKLVAIENSVEAAQLAGAEAALNQRLAGATPEQIAVYQAAVDAAKAALQQNNGSQSLITEQAKASLVASLQQSLPVLDSGLTAADGILAVDNKFANEAFKNYLAAKDPSKMYTAYDLYYSAKFSSGELRNKLGNLNDSSSDTEAKNVANFALSTLNDMSKLLASVSDVLNASITDDRSFSQATLDAKKNLIQTVRASVTAQNAAVLAKAQAVDLASSTLEQKQAAYDQAVATLKVATDPVRDVDVGPLRASVEAAVAVYNKTILRSPISGEVSRIDAKVGGLVVTNVTIASVINSANFQIETYVPETSVGKIKVGDEASVTVDAYGSGTVFPAKIASVDQSATMNGGTQSYKVVLVFESNDERLKVGMNSNISIKVGEAKGVLALPRRSILQQDEKYFVMTKNGGNTIQKEVEVGVKGEELWEVKSGLNEGDEVINFGN